MRKKNAFTLIELLIIVAIIGLLASIILVSWMTAARNKAAVNAYKTSMDSVRAGAEICYQSGGIINSGVAPGSPLCDYGGSPGATNYPTFNARCGSVGNFVANNPGFINWEVTTETGCKGCRLRCSMGSCVQIPASPGDCY